MNANLTDSLSSFKTPLVLLTCLPTSFFCSKDSDDEIWSFADNGVGTSSVISSILIPIEIHKS